jgi:hypothetical protein
LSQIERICEIACVAQYSVWSNRSAGGVKPRYLVTHGCCIASSTVIRACGSSFMSPQTRATVSTVVYLGDTQSNLIQSIPRIISEELFAARYIMSIFRTVKGRLIPGRIADKECKQDNTAGPSIHWGTLIRSPLLCYLRWSD